VVGRAGFADDAQPHVDENGLARYSEILYLEHVNGRARSTRRSTDTYVEALTVDQPPLIQSARLEDYSPEFGQPPPAKARQS